MSENKNTAVRHTGVPPTRDTYVKLSQKKMKAKTRLVGFKQSESPSFPSSHSCCRDDFTTYFAAFTTPKRRPTVRFNCSCSGDSPNETEPTQDIIWDPNSPTQNLKGHGNGRVIEISEIVSRIAPKVDKAKDGDSVLQWLGDGEIPCTPESRGPRVRRVSARQSNVEDLKKLAKQFDISMTRQDKEKEQQITEERNKHNKLQSICAIKTEESSLITLSEHHNLSSQACKEEAELSALFDGPTQHVSGRLSPPSVNCTQETPSQPDADAHAKINSTSGTSAPVAAKAKPYDDDWDSDDLNDLIVLEMTQNPEARACSKKTESTLTKTLPEVRLPTESTLKPFASSPGQTIEKLLKMSPVRKANWNTCSSQIAKEVNHDPLISKSPSAQFHGVSEADMQSLFNSDGLWNDEDDDLLFRACDDVETQIQKPSHREKHTPVHDKDQTFASKATTSCNIGIVTTKHVRVFARCNSAPIGRLELNQGSPASHSSISIAPQHGNDHSQIGGKTSSSHRYAFKRHLSDSMTLENKVFIPSISTLQCSAAEIERKKQEAIARRRLRMQTSQKAASL